MPLVIDSDQSFQVRDGNAVRHGGRLSALGEVNLDAEARQKAGIPADAKYYAFAYPVSNERVKADASPVDAFWALGGFVYLGQDKQRVVGVNGLHIVPSASHAKLILSPPQPISTALGGRNTVSRHHLQTALKGSPIATLCGSTGKEYFLWQPQGPGQVCGARTQGRAGL